MKSNAFDQIEIHSSFIEDGISTMRKMDSLKIPENSEVKLDPGGYHLMLISPIKEIKEGNVVALIGDFEPASILALIQIMDMGVIVVPLTKDTKNQHDYFFKSALVDIIIEDGVVKHRKHTDTHPLIEKLREQKIDQLHREKFL